MVLEYVSPMCEICNRIISKFDLPDVLSIVVKTAAESLNAKASVIRLISSRGNTLEMGAAYGLSQEYLDKGPVAINSSLIDQEALVGNIATVLDATTDERFQYSDEAKREGIRSVLCLPLRAGIKTIGVIRVYTEDEHEFTEDEVKLLNTLGCHGAVAIENARLRGQLKRQYDELMGDIWHWYEDIQTAREKI
jgi:GAF domain-containing protein